MYLLVFFFLNVNTELKINTCIFFKYFEDTSYMSQYKFQIYKLKISKKKKKL